jgi:MSHA type pilus biogenesis protein MshL
MLAAPRPPKIGESRLVSLSVTDDVPLKDVLIELARLADVDVEIDSGIKGGISFRAKDRPFNEVIERIANLAGLRYEIQHGVLRIERDVPYIQNYNLDFLNIVRSSSSNTKISTDVLSLSSSASGSTSGESSGISTGSSSAIESKADDDLWKSLENGVKQILAYTPKSRSDGSGSDADAEKASAEEDKKAEDKSKKSGTDDNSELVINKRAGILSVSATHQQHELIKEFLSRIATNASAQVLIEAKIVEVSLDDEFSSGIDWSMLKGNGTFNIAQDVDNTASNLTTLALTDGNLGVDLNAAVKLTQTFGAAHTLSSPRLHAINNQQAVLTFAENRIFFEVKIQKEPDKTNSDGSTEKGATSIESIRRSVPIGIILNIIPSVNLEDNEVTLNVRPTLSRQVSTVVDPGSALINQQIIAENPNAETFVNEVPIVEVRELDSVLKIKSGQVMVIGGLMEEAASSTEKGMPGMSEVPWFGNLFKSQEKSDKVKELIIFIRATIINPNGNSHQADQDIYKTFTSDSRPLTF